MLQNGLNKFRMPNFGHSKFLLVFLGKIVRKNLEWFLTIFLGKIVRKNLEWPLQISSSLFGEKLFENNLEWPLLAILNLYQSFWEKLSEKIWNSHFGSFKISSQFFEKNCWGKFGTVILWAFQISSSLLGKNCWEKFGSEKWLFENFSDNFCPKNTGRNLEQPKLHIPNTLKPFRC